MGSFEITDELQRILGWYRKHWREIKQLHNPYIFPILNGFHQSEKQKITRSEKVRKTVNASLKEIGEMIGASIKITTYTARHSLANELVRTGQNVSLIQQVLRHQSIQTTQHYLKQFDTREIDRAIANL
jgi:site-specific recombinase XerD